jgi:hypothetical protein
MDIMDNAKRGKLRILKKMSLFIFRKTKFVGRTKDGENNLFHIAVMYNITHAPFNIQKLYEPTHPSNCQSSTHTDNTHRQEGSQI